MISLGSIRSVFLAAGILCLGVFFFPASPSCAADSHTLAAGANTEITEHTECRVVENTSGQTIFIPSKTSGEWASFYATPPAGVTAVACAPPFTACNKKIEGGAGHFCAIAPSGRLLCWGGNAYGQLGDNTTGTRSTPVFINDGASGGLFNAVTAGSNHTCVIDLNGKAYCWGRNFRGEVGDNTASQRNTPVAVLNGTSPGTFREISGGGAHTCAIAIDSKAYCWGINNFGMLGDGSTDQRNAPVTVLNGDSAGTFKKISAGMNHTCAIGTDDKAYCWGNGGGHQLGNTSTSNRTQPILVHNGEGPGTYKDIHANSNNTCAIGTNDKAYCWGTNAAGQNGDNTTTLRQTPVEVVAGDSPGTFLAVTGGGNNHTCALGTDGKSYCWGHNTYGQVGDGTTSQRNAPRLSVNGAGPGTYRATAGASTGNCAIGTDDKVYCVGLNSMYEVGDGTNSQRNSPTLTLNGAGTGSYASCPDLAPPPPAFTVIGTTTGTGTDVTLPVGAQAGDVVVIFTYLWANLTAYTATGTTEIAGHASDGSSIRTFAKILTGSEGGTIGGLIGGTSWISVVYRPGSTLSGFTAHAPSTSFNWQHQSNTLSSGNAPSKPAIALAHFAAPFNVDGRRTITPNTMTEVPGPDLRHYGHYNIFNTGEGLNNFDLQLTDGGSQQKTQSVTLVFTYDSGIPCPASGLKQGAYCYYAATGGNCNDACSAQSLAFSAAGSQLTEEACTDMLDALGQPHMGLSAYTSWAGSYMGCQFSYNSGERYVGAGTPVSGAESDPGVVRACGCNAP